MERVARFEKVSYEEWNRAIKDIFGEAYSESDVQTLYENIKLPVRATSGSAGYDFFTPISFEIDPDALMPDGGWHKGTIKIPTGIKVKIDSGWFLQILPRSSVGFKYFIRLANTCGVIDEDYYNNEDNEGHIMIKLCDAKQTVRVIAGDRVAQGIFLPFGVTYDDKGSGMRKGGIGSTNI